MNKMSSKVTPHIGKSGVGTMEEREFLRASPGSLQGLNEDVGWWEQHSTGQVLVSTQKFTDISAAPQLRWQRKGAHFLLVAHIFTGIGEHRTFTANLKIFNHIMMFHPRISAPNVCFFRKLN